MGETRHLKFSEWIDADEF